MYIFYDIVHLYRCLREGLVHTESAGVLPQWFQGIRRGDGIAVLGKNLFNYRYRERLETDSVVGNISGEKEAE